MIHQGSVDVGKDPAVPAVNRVRPNVYDDADGAGIRGGSHAGIDKHLRERRTHGAFETGTRHGIVKQKRADKDVDVCGA